MRLPRTPLALFLGLLAAASAGRATTLVRMDLEQLATAAQVVARVRCLDTASRWDAGHIWTFTTFEVLETFKGFAPREITVRLIGGRVGSLHSVVDGVPRFRAGEEAILFLEPTPAGEHTVVSWVQGTFRIRRVSETGRATVTQDTSGLAVFDPATRRARSGAVRNLPLAEFQQRVAEAVRKGATRQP